MGVTAWIGPRQQANDAVTLLALDSGPALILDCANSADPHRYHGRVSAEQLRQAHVISLDLLYNFRESLKRVPQHLSALDTKLLAVTTQDHLFTYHDEDENTDIRAHTWQLLSRLGKRYDVHVAVKENSVHEAWAKKYADETKNPMGHTTSSQRQVAKQLVQELEQFIAALPADDQARMHQLLDEPLKHLGSITSASSLHTWAFLILCIILEREKCG